MSAKPKTTPAAAAPATGLVTHVVLEDRNLEMAPMQFFRLMRRIFSYARPHRRLIILLFFLTTIRSIQLPMLGHFLSIALSGPVAHRDFHGTLLAAAGFMAFAAFTQFTFGFRIRLALELGELIVRDMRNAMFRHLQELTASFFHSMKVGRLISRMSWDLEAIRLGVQDVVFMNIVGAGQAFVAALLMFRADRVLFAVLLFMGPIIWYMNRHFSSRLQDAQRRAQESFSRVTATLAESVTGIRVTQGFVRQEINAALFRDLIVDHSRYNVSAGRAAAIFIPLVELNSQLFVGLLLAVGGWRVLHGHSTLSGIVEFFFQSALFFDSLRGISSQYTQGLTALVGAERVFRLLDTKPEWSDSPHPRPLADLRGEVEFRNVTFAYQPGRPVLRDISFHARPGQVIALVGHTGSGKTSITNLVTKAWLPTTGTILLDGRDLAEISTPSLRKHLGVVQQSNFLFEGTVLDNVRFSRTEASEEQVRETARQLDCLDLFEALPQGWQTQVGEAGNALSLGQRQLVCFARALLADPRILVLDEATSSIDAITESRIQTSLAVLLRGRTSFVVAHRLSSIRRADLILVLREGEIIERGRHADLLALNGAYKELYTQFVRTGAPETEG